MACAGSGQPEAGPRVAPWREGTASWQRWAPLHLCALYISVLKEQHSENPNTLPQDPPTVNGLPHLLCHTYFLRVCVCVCVYFIP